LEDKALAYQSMNRLHLYALWFALTLLIFYGWNGVLPHQLAEAPLFDISLDNTFWAFHLSGIPAWLIQKPLLLIVLEVALIGLGVATFFKNKIYLNVGFLSLFLLILGLQQTYSCTLTKTSVIFPIVFLPFCLPKNWWPKSWLIPRYYLVYLMASAGMFKFLNGGIFYPEQMQNILSNQHLDLLFFESQHISGKLSQLLGSMPVVATVIYWLTALVEFSFITLLFTRRLDGFFAIVLVLFVLAIYLVFRIYTLDILVLFLPLFPYLNRNE
jgi:hypothetical protein